MTAPPLPLEVWRRCQDSLREVFADDPARLRWELIRLAIARHGMDPAPLSRRPFWRKLAQLLGVPPA